MKLFGREPTLWIQAVSALLGIIVAFGMDWLTGDQAAAITAVVSAGFGALNAMVVRPIAPAAFTGLVAAAATLLAAFGLDFNQEQVGMVQVAVLAVLSLITRNQVTPKNRMVPTAPSQGTVS
jgi:uncharacterized membrane protein